MHLRVAAVNFTNFFTLRKTEAGGYVGIEGIEYEFLKILAVGVNFTYQLTSPDDGSWGRKMADGSWDGMIGMLLKNEADIMVDITTITYARKQVVDFSFPYVVDKNSFAIQKAGLAPKDFAYLYPFQIWVWICTILTFLVSVYTLAKLHVGYLNIYSKKTAPVYKYLFPSTEILLGYRACRTTGNRSISVLLTFSDISLLFIKLCFTGVFLSFLMYPVMSPQIKTVDQLAEACRKGQQKVSTYPGSALEHYLLTAESGSLYDIGAFLREHPELTFVYGDIIPIVMDGYVIVDAYSFLSLQSPAANSKIFVSEDSLNVLMGAVVFRRGFCCIKRFDKIITRIHQAGLYDKIVTDRIFRISLQRQGDETHDDTDSVRPISVSDLAGLFWVVLPCYFLAIVILIIERLTAKRAKAGKLKLRKKKKKKRSV